MFYFAIINFIDGAMLAGFLQGFIALFFLALLIRNICIVTQERKGYSVSGCKISDSVAKFFKKRER